MNVKKVVGLLKKKYPGKKIIINTPDNPGEIVCEIDQAEIRSMAVAVIDRTRLHYHRELTEVYEVTKGKLMMYLDGKKHVVKKGEKIEMRQGVRHYAVGDETWINVYSTPGWKPEDHILVTDEREVSRKEFDKVPFLPLQERNQRKRP